MARPTDLDAAPLGPLSELANARAEALDVRSRARLGALVDRIEREVGPIDIGVNVAGILRTGLAAETDDRSWSDVFDVNASGVFHVSRALARHMIGRRRGNIVTVSSNADVQDRDPAR